MNQEDEEPQYPAFKQSDLLYQLRALATNFNFIIFMISACLVISQFLIMMTVLEIVMAPYSYTKDEVSLFGMVINMMGIVGGIIASAILFFNRQLFKSMTLSSMLMSIISLAVFNLSLVYLPHE